MATASDGGACVFKPRERRVRQVLTACTVIAPVPALRIEAPAPVPSHYANRRHVAFRLVPCAEVHMGEKRSAARKWELRYGVAHRLSG